VNDFLVVGMSGFLSVVVLSTLLFTGLFLSQVNAEPMPSTDGSAEQQIRTQAKQGNAEAQVKLAMMYANGEGVVRDDKQAAFWFRKAADQGEAMAQFNLGWI
jgi:TPR repeat protein